MSFDIIRRILEEYFGYDVLYVMNITDIDDKIIINARQQYLFKEFQKEHTSISPLLIQESQKAWNFYVEKRFKDFGLESAQQWSLFKDKPKPDPLEHPKFNLYFTAATKASEALQNASSSSIESFFAALQDPLSLYLDNIKGTSVTDPKIYRDFAAFWENDFFKDMDKINVRRPDVLTRVSEYVPEIVSYVEKIIANGYGYEIDGSVYFDTAKFHNTEGHDYAKLEPWSAGNLKLVQEGEGDLSSSTTTKKSPSDFALWKGSKPGEPFWDSPWGKVTKANN
jgi:cysteinyl-tRNA synthetase